MGVEKKFLTDKERNELIAAIQKSPYYMPNENEKVPEELLNRKTYDAYLKAKEKLSVRDLAEITTQQYLNKLKAVFHGISNPSCHLCKKPVPKFSRDFDVKRQEYLFIGECHGDVEIVHANAKRIFRLRKPLLVGTMFQEGGAVRSEGVRHREFSHKDY